MTIGSIDITPLKFKGDTIGWICQHPIHHARILRLKREYLHLLTAIVKEYALPSSGAYLLITREEIALADGSICYPKGYSAYVGKTGNFKTRITRHNNDPKKGPWCEFVYFPHESRDEFAQDAENSAMESWFETAVRESELGTTLNENDLSDKKGKYQSTNMMTLKEIIIPHLFDVMELFGYSLKPPLEILAEELRSEDLIAKKEELNWEQLYEGGYICDGERLFLKNHEDRIVSIHFSRGGEQYFMLDGKKCELAISGIAKKIRGGRETNGWTEFYIKTSNGEYLSMDDLRVNMFNIVNNQLSIG